MASGGALFYLAPGMLGPLARPHASGRPPHSPTGHLGIAMVTHTIGETPIGKCQHRWRQCMKTRWGAKGANSKPMTRPPRQTQCTPIFSTNFSSFLLCTMLLIFISSDFRWILKGVGYAWMPSCAICACLYKCAFLFFCFFAQRGNQTNVNAIMIMGFVNENGSKRWTVMLQYQRRNAITWWRCARGLERQLL